jgi:aryl-alcohol dehydrogenase-like predicted oxidoreductase
MQYRKYTKNSPPISSIGFGSWQLGNAESWSEMSDAEAINLVKEALSQGVNFFDTAPGYSNGNSERLLGKAFQGVDRRSIVINTKFGHTADGKTDFRPESLRKSIEGSLSRLKTDYLDSVLLHNPSRDLMDPERVPHYEILEKLIEEGKILAYGASLDSYEDMTYFMSKTKGEVLEIFFNILHQDVRPAFEMAKKKGIALIAKVPLDSGWLSGKYNQNSTFSGIRSRWSSEDIKRRGDVIDLIRDLPSKNQTMSQFALSYCLAYDEIATVIPGCVSIEQLNDNLASIVNPMSPDMVKKLEQLYDDSIKPMNLPW